MIARRESHSLWFDCSKKELIDQLDWLTAHGAHFVTLGQIEGYVRNKKPLPPKSIAITFADNYLGFLNVAYPILKSRHIPVTMFVHTGYVGSSVGRPKMSWIQLKQLDREGLVTIGSQTVSHVDDLRKTPDSEIRKEFIVSKRELEKHLGHITRYLAYPNGKFDQRSERIAQEVGYVLAFSEVQAPIELSKSPYSLNRYVHTKWRKAWLETTR